MQKAAAQGAMVYVRLLSFTRAKLKGMDLGSAQEATVFYDSFRAGIRGWKQPAQTVYGMAFLLSQALVLSSKLHLLS